MQLRSTPFPKEVLRMGAVSHLRVSFCQKHNTSFKMSICMGGMMSSIYPCCIFKKRKDLQSPAGGWIDLYLLFDGDTISWGYSSVCNQTPTPWAAPASASVPCTPFQL